MGDTDDNEAYYLEEVTVEADNIDAEKYEGVDEDEDSLGEEEEDNFDTMLRTIKNEKDGIAPPTVTKKTTGDARSKRAGLKQKATVVDDFVRNFLVKLNMKRTLDMFNTEWYEMKEQGKLNEEDIGSVTDLYERNENLDDQVKELREEVEKANSIAEKARGTWDKFRKERDFHRMHHRRVVQEKNVLIRDMKRLQKHYSTFEPALKAMRHKYEQSVKEKTMFKMERDRMAQKLEREQANKEQEPPAPPREPSPQVRKENKPAVKKSAGAQLPPDDRINPYLEKSYEPMDAHTLSLQKTFKGHQMAVSGVAIHPSKPIVATVSDDRTWKMWSLQRGELIMSGDGHKDWIGSCDFHPGGGMLATASGDGTVKIWDFLQARCSMTLTDHTQAVWNAVFHDTGDFLVSASMDHTARLWDVVTGKCRQTIRGHVDSVNRVAFQPYSNNICTASGDKTVSLWDCRSGLCIQTFYGHENAVLSAAFSAQGDTVASADSDGVIKLWDVRMVQERTGFAIPGRGGPVNDVKFDISGKRVLAACDDTTVKVFDAHAGENPFLGELEGFEGPVQSIAVDPKGKYIVGGGADQTWRVFS